THAALALSSGNQRAARDDAAAACVLCRQSSCTFGRAPDPRGTTSKSEAHAIIHTGWDGAARRSSSGSPSPLRSPAACLCAIWHAPKLIAGIQRAPELSWRREAPLLKNRYLRQQRDVRTTTISDRKINQINTVALFPIAD